MPRSACLKPCVLPSLGLAWETAHIMSGQAGVLVGVCWHSDKTPAKYIFCFILPAAHCRGLPEHSCAIGPNDWNTISKDIPRLPPLLAGIDMAIQKCIASSDTFFSCCWCVLATSVFDSTSCYCGGMEMLQTILVWRVVFGDAVQLC